MFGGYRYWKKYNHFTCRFIRLFDPLYKKTTLNILNMAHLKFETSPLRRTPHETNVSFSGNANFFGNAKWLEILTFCKD
ncbi:hypothetical protein CWO31_00190 [Vibrio splendidus]|nr:hypothetical protein CWO31_00190 [Vibrio splendidus]